MLYVDDADFRLLVGDVRDQLRELPDGSVDCVVTSPPFWGLRDYGTGRWEGGDPDCDHKLRNARNDPDRDTRHTDGRNPETNLVVAVPSVIQFRDVCGKCGAQRKDQQLGLEPTPDAYVAQMVAVFREIRRVLADHGTVWLNLGDSYAGSGATAGEGWDGQQGEVGSRASWAKGEGKGIGQKRHHPPGGLKPKDLVGIPWRVAFALQADGWYLRADIIWAKPNPMPESVTDRPTKAHEYVFLLSKRPTYHFDQEAVREPHSASTFERWNGLPPRTGNAQVYEVPGRSDFQAARNGGESSMGANPGGRNVRSVWEIEQETLDPSLPPEKPRGPDGRRKTVRDYSTEGGHANYADMGKGRERWPNPGGSNVRSVWHIATQPYPEAHFATFPEELARRCILAGCPTRVCLVCGRPSERIVKAGAPIHVPEGRSLRERKDTRSGSVGAASRVSGVELARWRADHPNETVGWSDCDHNQWRPGRVLDLFLGSGTTAKVARDLGRHAIGIELNEAYAELAARRLQQQSLFAEGAS